MKFRFFKGERKMKDKNFERREMLKKAGYFTVETFLEKLTELKEKRLWRQNGCRNGWPFSIL